jgi:hypothetical protein
VDEDLLVRYDRFAIGVAGVIDEAGVAATPLDGAIYHRFLVERKKKGMMALHLRVVVAPIGLVVIDALAGVLDNLRPFPYPASRENSPAVNS